jgi:2-iminobutanoate/2-iminopropanoate deaminase
MPIEVIREQGTGGKPRATLAGGYVFAVVNAADSGGRLPAGISTVADETRACLQRLREVLDRAGASLADVVKINCYLADNSLRGEFWGTYNEFFTQQPLPVRCTYAMGIADGCRVQLDAVAIDPRS